MGLEEELRSPFHESSLLINFSIIASKKQNLQFTICNSELNNVSDVGCSTVSKTVEETRQEEQRKVAFWPNLSKFFSFILSSGLLWNVLDTLNRKGTQQALEIDIDHPG